ncbi:hypothetical protein B0H19DRAFT_1191291 [Mycena capillaripes]|nr:hypothetical protein B0H19DRAFT_1191291 [Mycena capillaripes]
MLAEEHSSPLSPDSASDWYDPEESTHDFEHPKFWSEEDQEVIVGIKQRTAAISLTTLVGTYRWFYEFPEPGSSDPQWISYHDSEDVGKNSPGYLTITCPAGKKPTLKNITGTVVHFGKEGRFSGIKRAKDQEKNLVNNHWDFCSFHWKENYGDNQDEGNSILALEVSDDNGEPFVMFRYASPAPLLGHMWFLDIAAKKERRPNDHGLSTAEMARLGMQAEYPEVRAAAQAAASDEESESESSSDDESAEEKEKPKPAGKRKPDSNVDDPDSPVRPKKRKTA